MPTRPGWQICFARAEVGGSDAHAMASVGCAWTVVPGARNRQEYLQGLRRGMGRVRGETGGYRKLMRDVFAIGREMVRENPATLPIAALGWMVPFIILHNSIKEAIFARWWMARYMQSCSLKRSGRPDCRGDRMTFHGTMLNYISRRDHKLMRRINRWPAPRWIRLWALCATRGGDGWLWYGMGAMILLFGGPMRFRAVGAAALAAAAGNRHLPQIEEGHRTQAALRL